MAGGQRRQRATGPGEEGAERRSGDGDGSDRPHPGDQVGLAQGSRLGPALPVIVQLRHCTVALALAIELVQ